MKYDPIEIVREENNIEFYFMPGKRWFYEIHSLTKNGKYDLGRSDWWDEHLKEKMWYTPELREKVLALMEEIVDEKELKNDYFRSQGLTSEYRTPKQRKANQVKWIYKYGDKEIKHLTSKQLGAMILKSN